MAKKYSKEEIFNKICEILESEFEIEKSKLNKDANLFTDLDLDSTPDEFKQIRTLNDVVETIYKLL